MYVILVNDDNTLYCSNKETIMQRSSLVDNLCFLVNPMYKEYDMSDCTVLLEYLLPVSKKYCTEILTLADEGYEEYLKYVLPFDTKLTSEAGSIEVQLTFAKASLDEEGNGLQQVRKTSTAKINIVPIAAWSDIIPDSALSALDQRILKIDAQLKALNDTADTLGNNMVDNIKYDDVEDTLQLTSKGNGIGDKISVKDMMEDGVPVVDFNSSSGGDNPDKPSDDDDDVVEFDDVKEPDKPVVDDDIVNF